MTQISVAPQPMPGVAPSQAAASPGMAGEAANAAEGTADFAALLKAQIGRPAKDAAEAEILAALTPDAEAAAGEVLKAEEELPAAPDLSALLPTLAGLAPSAAETESPAALREGSTVGQANELPALAASTASHTTPPVSLAQADSHAADNAQSTPLLAAPGGSGSEAAAVQPLHAENSALPPAAEPSMPAAAAAHANPAATAQAAAPLVHAAPAGDAPATVRVDTPVGGRGWDAEVGQKIVLLANRQEGRAELTLTPPQLGRLEVTISVNGDQTSAAFVSASAAAREALEQALPRLREILAEAGITLGQASVNAESPRQDRDGASTQQRAEDRGRSGEVAGAAVPTQWLRRSEGLIDTFA